MGRRPRFVVPLIAVTAAAALPSSALGAITIGSTLTNTPTTGFSSTSVTFTQTVPQGRSFVSPVDGAVVLWRWLNPLGGSARARVLRSSNGGAVFTGAGTGPVSTSPSGGAVPFTLSVPLPIRAGDFFGVDQFSNGALSFSNAVSPATNEGHWSPVLGDGVSPIAPGQSSLELLVNADVEPEVTTITVQPRPKVRTIKKRVHAPFSWRSNQLGLGFECSLDGSPFSPCRAPIDYFVKPGAHNFQVEATLEGKKFGNTASFAFSVKKRKKKKKH